MFSSTQEPQAGVTSYSVWYPYHFNFHYHFGWVYKIKFW